MQLVNAIADWVFADPFLVTAFSRSRLEPGLEDTEARLINLRPVAAKRNSELLNSLLGLPKNILRSGRK
jgi:hypothetical protein